ncbi:MAG: hypothetical protein C0525_01315 [Flavobacterium sp.]|uniref:hypothetical protein n=1 Tax=Flavobacterium sp. TaxID=239 RepID=UPI0025BAF523|nr:hypothetical protein [Flavobacterium sp.]MBA4133340.1 hypothetical protein [Flavobacterium sp.]
MARTKAQIREEIKASFINNPALIELYDLTPGQTFDEQFSITSVESIWLEQFVDMIYNHELIVSANAANSRPQNLPNFIATVYNFHDGLPLVWKDGQFTYDLTEVENPEERKIVSRCAVLESEDGELVVKVAKLNVTELEPLADVEAERLLFYLNQMKVPGVRIRLINEEADQLKVTLNVYVDPLQIDLNTGRRLNITEDIFPVKDAIKSYLTNLEFNGAFVTNFFERSIQSESGINLAVIELLQHKFAAFDFTDFTAFKVPQSGYFKISDEDLTINYLPYVLVNS